MNPFFKALIGIVVVAVIAGAGIFYQYKAAPGDAIGFTQDEMNLFADKNLGARDRAQLATDPAKRKDLLEKLGKQLAVVAEANRRGLGSTDEALALDEFTTAQVLQSVYVEAHPELAKSAPGPHGGGGPQAPQAEVDAWTKAHGDDINRYQQAMATVSKGMPPMQPQNFASAFVFAQKARDEGLDKKPETRLQLKLARYGLLYQQMDTKLEEETKYSDDDVKKYFEEHKATGDLDQIHAQHILLATVPIPSAADPTGGSPDPVAKKKLADELLQRVKNGEDFSELAKQYSDDPGSKDKGGDLGWSGRFKFFKEFEDVAWKLQPGQVSDLVKTDVGYHIIKMIERKPPEELTPQTTEELKDALSQRRFESAVDELAKNNTVELPADFTVTAPSPAELAPQMPPGMQGGQVPGGADMGDDEDDGGPAPAPQPAAKGEPKKPASKPAPAKKGAK